METRVLRHYNIVEKIGQGGMGVVYKAWDTHLDRFVAIKMLPPETTADADRRWRFVLEAKTASALNHPSIVTIHDIAEENGAYFIVMEYVSGKTLRAAIGPGGMSVEDATKFGVQIADALATAHAAGVIHRDLKPANILITSDHRVKVVDFGLAKLTEEPADETTQTMAAEHTATGVLMGTAGYVSPEQLKGCAADARSDLFSLGIVLYEMLTGGRPFGGTSSVTIMASILHEEPPPLYTHRSDVSPDLEQLVFSCLQKDPRRRMRSAAELRDALAALASERSHHRFAGGMVQAPDAPSIAVLPFANLSSDRENDYFSDGLAEDILNLLTRVPKIRVTARASAFAFRPPNYDIHEIAEKLQVEYILDGGVRRIQNRVRVTVSLIKLADGFQVWSERFDRQMTDIFEIQDEISAAVVEKLRGHLTGEIKPAARRAQNIDVEAYKLYLKGRFHSNRRTWTNLLQSLDCFQTALQIDSQYVEAYTGMADTFNLLGYYNQRPPRDAYSLAKDAVKKALEIDPENAGAHASLGFTTLLFDWNWKQADQEFRRSIERDPENARAHHWHAWYFFATRQYEAGIAAMNRAHDRDPLAPIVNDHLGLSYSLAGQQETALEKIHAAVELDPSFALAHYRLGWIYLQKTEYEAATAPLRRAVELSDGRTGLGLLGLALARSGRSEEALQVLVTLAEKSENHYTSPLELSLVNAGLGDLERTFACLADAVNDRVSDLVLFLSYPWPENVRRHPRFPEIASRVGLN